MVLWHKWRMAPRSFALNGSPLHLLAIASAVAQVVDGAEVAAGSQAATRLKRAFARAISNAPAVLFIDSVEALAPARCACVNLISIPILIMIEKHRHCVRDFNALAVLFIDGVEALNPARCADLFLQLSRL